MNKMNSESETRTIQQIDQEYATACQQYAHNLAVNEEIMTTILALRKEGQALKAKTEGKTE
jgi:hypothetical protein